MTDMRGMSKSIIEQFIRLYKAHPYLWKIKDDSLSFLINPIHFGMKKRLLLINMVKGIIITYLQIFNVIGVVYICKDSRSYLHPYISGILIQQIGISSHALVMFYTRDILHLSKTVEQFFLPFNAAGTKVHRELYRQCVLMRKLFPLSFIMLTAAHCGLLPIVSNLGDYQFTLVFLKEHFGASYIFFQGVYYLCLLTSGYSIASLCCVSVYLAVHLKFQLHLLVSYLERISYDMRHNDAVFCQDVIHKRLIDFVQAHVKIKTLSVRFLNIGKWSVLVTAVTCSLLYTSLVHFLTMGIGPINNLLSSLGLVVAAVVTYVVTNSGQLLQDESTNLYIAACHCKWADWNAENRKTLLMIIINTSKKVKITSYGILDVGNEIMLRMLKLTYSLVLLFLNLNK